MVGITPSQSARNTLAAGVAESHNTAQFLGHLSGQRGARGPAANGPGALLPVDEASMIGGLDLADLISLAEATGSKVILARDTGQLQAVEDGGGMSPARRLPRLRPARRAGEVPRRLGQAASLRLGAGDAAVLADYDHQARITLR